MGNLDGVDPDSLAGSVSSGREVPTPCTRRQSPLRSIAHSTRGRILSGRLSTFFRYFISGIPCTDISYPKFRAPTFYIRNSVRRHFTSGYLTAGWERRTFQLLRSDISGSSDSAYLESFSLSIQCCGVLLKLPNIFDRHLEIFCFRYLLSKSSNSPCNPPIIGFLSL